MGTMRKTPVDCTVIVNGELASTGASVSADTAGLQFRPEAGRINLVTADGKVNRWNTFLP